MSNFHGYGKTQSYFEGWYFKHQKGEHTIAFIPGIGINKTGERTAFIQVITDHGSNYITYPASEFWASEDRLVIRVGNSIFGDKGITLDIKSKQLCVKGSILYGPLTPLRSNIMGPFSVMPFMQCNHDVISMQHTLKGALTINGGSLDLNGGTGYLEKDWGRSFPKAYLWTQCNTFARSKCSVMASVAHIPFLGGSFQGCICAVYYKGREYRLATYRGVKIEEYGKERLVLRQGKYLLEITLLKGAPQKLFAPSCGQMSRTIHENAACTVQYRFYSKDRKLFDLQSSSASFEYV